MRLRWKHAIEALQKLEDVYRGELEEEEEVPLVPINLDFGRLDFKRVSTRKQRLAFKIIIDCDCDCVFKCEYYSKNSIKCFGAKKIWH